MKKSFLTVGIVCLLPIYAFFGSGPQFGGIVPAKGYVPDEATAIRVAEAICVGMFGPSVLEKERPFTAKLEGQEVWIVTGSLPKGFDGGVAMVWISKTDGKILGVSHGK